MAFEKSIKYKKGIHSILREILDTNEESESFSSFSEEIEEVNCDSDTSDVFDKQIYFEDSLKEIESYESECSEEEFKDDLIDLNKTLNNNSMENTISRLKQGETVTISQGNFMINERDEKKLKEIKNDKKIDIFYTTEQLKGLKLNKDRLTMYKSVDIINPDTKLKKKSKKQLKCKNFDDFS